MAKYLKEPHICLFITFISTVILYYFIDLTIITISWFLAGIILSVIHFVKDELIKGELSKDISSD
ncbi:hypothetical protein ACFYKX_16950 [Cytobacillus sp. FJAT-54145]|uniref:Uncharacterized protein n=1 Tax=Cytobacillus spartinae TaxID=3299023 RepID=A0ABW6KDN1_9BACI